MVTPWTNRMGDRSGPGAPNKHLTAELSLHALVLEGLACGHLKCLHDSTLLVLGSQVPRDLPKVWVNLCPVWSFFFFRFQPYCCNGSIWLTKQKHFLPCQFFAVGILWAWMVSQEAKLPSSLFIKCLLIPHHSTLKGAQWRHSSCLHVDPA